MLSADEVRQLDALSFSAAGAAFSSDAAGARVGRVQGFSTEFHDFRPYQPGDDPRAIEWTIYARLGELVTRTSRTTAHLHVHLLVDASASMNLGAPAKMSCAVKLAALLSYVALRSRDAVGLATFRDSLDERLTPAASRTQMFRIFAALDRAAPSGRSAIAAALMNCPPEELQLTQFNHPLGLEGARLQNEWTAKKHCPDGFVLFKNAVESDEAGVALRWDIGCRAE